MRPIIKVEEGISASRVLAALLWGLTIGAVIGAVIGAALWLR